MSERAGIGEDVRVGPEASGSWVCLAAGARAASRLSGVLVGSSPHCPQSRRREASSSFETDAGLRRSAGALAAPRNASSSGPQEPPPARKGRGR